MSERGLPSVESISKALEGMFGEPVYVGRVPCGLAMGVPLRGLDGDLIGLYLVPSGDNVCLEDDGQTLGELLANAKDESSTVRQIDASLSANALSKDSDDVTIISPVFQPLDMEVMKKNVRAILEVYRELGIQTTPSLDDFLDGTARRPVRC